MDIKQFLAKMEDMDQSLFDIHSLYIQKECSGTHPLSSSSLQAFFIFGIETVDLYYKMFFLCLISMYKMYNPSKVTPSLIFYLSEILFPFHNFISLVTSIEFSNRLIYNLKLAK